MVHSHKWQIVLKKHKWNRWRAPNEERTSSSSSVPRLLLANIKKRSKGNCPKVLRMPRTPKYTKEVISFNGIYHRPDTLCMMGNRYHLTISVCIKGKKVLSCSSRLLHEMGRSRSRSHKQHQGRNRQAIYIPQHLPFRDPTTYHNRQWDTIHMKQVKKSSMRKTKSD